MAKHRLTFYLLTATLLLMFLATSASAANVGRVSGKVVDRETGEPLPSVAVSLVGTTMGGLTSNEGVYVILNVPVGDYAIKAELVGYQPVEVQGIHVSIDLTTYNDFQLSSKTIEVGEVQVVQAERPLIIKDQTATLRLYSNEDVRNLPAANYQDVVGLSTGVVVYSDNTGTRPRGGSEISNNPSLNIRGGRPNEVAYYIDGFSTSDPITGLATTTINNNAIEEISITTGGFNAEYGWIASGAINVTTREGTKHYRGNIESVTDRVLADYNYNVHSIDVTGPVFPNSDRATFYFSGERRVQGDREPRALNGGEPLLHNDLRGWSWQGKLRYDLTQEAILRLGVIGSYDHWNRYLRAYHFDIAHGPLYEDRNNSVFAQLTHNLSKRTFYNLKFNYYLTQRKAGDGVYFDDLWGYIRPTGNPRFDSTVLFQSYDDPLTYYQVCCPDGSWCSAKLGPDDPVPEDAPCDPAELVYRYSYALAIDETTNAPTGDSTVLDESHVYDDYLQRRSAYLGGNFDLTHQLNSHNEVKVGLEFKRHTLRYVDHLAPVELWKGVEGGGLNAVDHYGYELVYDYTGDDTIPTGVHLVETNGGLDGAKHPYTFAAYVQDRLDYEGLIINAGLRYDYLNVNTKRLRSEDSPLDPYGTGDQELTEEDLQPAKAEQRLSPRLGIGYPVTERTVFHLYYGNFFQLPELQNLYVGYDFLEYMVSEHPFYYPIGNPNLEPEQTTAYEVGVAHQLGSNTRLDVTAYYKDVKNLTRVVNQPSLPNSFATYRNSDFGTIKGIEFSLKMRRTRNIAFDLGYTLSYANGTGSFANSQRNIAWTNSEQPLRVAPLDYDQRHKITANVDIRTGKGEGPKLGKFFPLERAGINLVGDIGSGAPYSPQKVYDEVTLASVSPTPAGPINSRYGPWTFRLDLKADRTFTVAGLDLNFYFWVLNVLNSDNAIDVYEGTGDPLSTGWLATPPGQDFIEAHADPDPVTGLTGEEMYNFKQRDPSNFDVPRLVRFGLRMSF